MINTLKLVAVVALGTTVLVVWALVAGLAMGLFS